MCADPQIDAVRSDARNRAQHALGDRVGMIKAGFSAGDAYLDGPARGKKVRPVDFFCAPFELVKSAGVESPQPHDHAARRAQPEIREINAFDRALEADAAGFLTAFDAECLELTRCNRFQARRSDGKKVEVGVAGAGR